MFWMRSDLIGPYLMLTTDDRTRLEYWEPGGRGGGAGGGAFGGGYRVFIHSAVAGAAARQGGTKWRQPNTSLTLSPVGRPGDGKTYGFKFQWADDYEAVRKNLVDDGKVDVHVVPGMTVPSDLFARFALNTQHKITGVEAEFPGKHLPQIPRRQRSLPPLPGQVCPTGREPPGRPLWQQPVDVSGVLLHRAGRNSD